MEIMHGQMDGWVDGRQMDERRKGKNRQEEIGQLAAGPRSRDNKGLTDHSVRFPALLTLLS